MKFIMKHASLFALLTIMALGTLIQANEDVTFINGRGLKKGSKKSGKSEKSAKSGKSPKSGKKRSKKDATSAPSSSPSAGPTVSPSSSPIEDVMTGRKKPKSPKSPKTTERPSQTPSESPSDAPSESPSDVPSGSPSDSPSDSPSLECPLPQTDPGLLQYTYPGYTPPLVPGPPYDLPIRGFANTEVLPINGPFFVDRIFFPIPPGNVGYSWRGNLYFLDVGDYYFCLQSIEDSVMYLGGTRFIDNEPPAQTGTLVCNWHYVEKCGTTVEFEVDYYVTQASTTSGIILSWNGGDGTINVNPVLPSDGVLYQPS